MISDIDGAMRLCPGGFEIAFERHFDVAVDALWRIVTDPQQLEGWIGGVVAKFEAREHGQILFLDRPDGNVTVTGSMLKVTDGRLLEFCWQMPELDGRPALTNTTMTWSLGGRDHLSSLALLHRIPADHEDRLQDLIAAWHLHLDRIPSMILGRPSQASTMEEFASMREGYSNLVKACVSTTISVHSVV
jgi:uncharacterized protein YndB with AHSA1/START domain